VTGVVLGPTNWRVWVLLAAAMGPLVTIFAFLDELNENIRFVRHQMRDFRRAVGETADEVAKYNDPAPNFSAYDALTSIDGKWNCPG
jgi:hypothetical protein